jgi:predicted secreted protein
MAGFFTFRSHLIPDWVTPPQSGRIMRIHNCLIFFTLISLAACSQPTSTSDLELNSSIHGKTASYPRNQAFTLQLDLWADAGYEWQCSINDTNIVRIDSTRYAPKSGNWNQVGGLTVETFFFSTLRVGQTVVTLLERRPWEPNAPPIDSVAFTVLVTPY